MILFSTACIASEFTVNEVVSDTKAVIYDTVKSPSLGSVGGEWAVIGLARSSDGIKKDFADSYYATIEKYVKEHNGVLDTRKYTEYSRVVIALTAIGKNPEDVGGYNLLAPLGDYEKTIYQGINGAVWALIALDCGGYNMPTNASAKVQATRQTYIDLILSRQNDDGGWSLSERVSNADVTAMALQALAKYSSQKKVANAIANGVDCLSKMQGSDGGFSSFGTANSESVAQVLVAMCELGISVDDARFVKNGNTVVDNILTFYEKGKGFKHTSSDTKANQMATEQCFYALVSLTRASDGKSSLYRIASPDSFGLPEKNADIAKKAVVNPQKTFSDIQLSSKKTAIEKLASRGIIDGRTQNKFEPNDTITRAEFSAITVKSLGLVFCGDSRFSDVNKNDWFYDYVRTAFHYGIIQGESQLIFNPNGTLTRQEALVMLKRTATLCGMDTLLPQVEITKYTTKYSDSKSIAVWATDSVAFCTKYSVIDNTATLSPLENVTRAEVAGMLYNMLCSAKLI